MLKANYIIAPKLELLNYVQVVSAQRGQSNLVTSIKVWLERVICLKSLGFFFSLKKNFFN